MEGGESMKEKKPEYSIPELLYKQDKKILYSNPERIQNEVLQTILSKNAPTRFGREYLFNEITDMADFKTYVPLSLYSDIHPYVQAMISGMTNTLVTEPIRAWAKTIGICGQMRLIPYTQSVSRGIIDAFLLLYTACAAHNLIGDDQKIFSGLESPCTDTLGTVPVETLSSLGLRDLTRTPGMGPVLTPSSGTTGIADIEKRWKEIALQSSAQNVGGIMEDPVLFLMFIKNVMNHECPHIDELWPQVSLFISHDGINPYQSTLKALFDTLAFRQIMCTDDIPVAVQIDSQIDCVPLSNQHVFEFIPVKEWKDMEEEGEHYREFEFSPRYLSTTIPEEEYILVITTSGGLYRYVPGDIVTMGDHHHMKRVGCISIREKRRSYTSPTVLVHH